MSVMAQWFFDAISCRHLIGGHNVCAPDWGETDCVYTFHKLYYFVGGSGTIIVDDTVFRPRSGDLFLIPAGTVHTFRHRRDDPVVQYWSHFDLRLGDSRRLTYAPESLWCRPSRERVEPAFRRLVAVDVAASGRSGGAEELLADLARQTALLHLLHLHLSHVDAQRALVDGGSTGGGEDVASRLDRFVAANLDRPITLDEMARELHMHPNTVITRCKRVLGMTPNRYVNARRLQEAVRRIDRRDEASLEKIAAQVGFRDYRYFSRLFRRRYGMSPSVYRQRSHSGS